MLAPAGKTPARHSKTKSFRDYRASGFRAAERSRVHRSKLTLLFGCRLLAETGKPNSTRLGWRLKLLCWLLQADTGPASKTKSFRDYRAAERSLVHRSRLTLLFAWLLQARPDTGLRVPGFSLLRVAEGSLVVHSRRLTLLAAWLLQARPGTVKPSRLGFRVSGFRVCRGLLKEALSTAAAAELELCSRSPGAGSCRETPARHRKTNSIRV